MLFKEIKKGAICFEIASGPDRYWYYIDKHQEEVKIKFGLLSSVLTGKIRYRFWRFVLGPFMFGVAKKISKCN